MIQQLLDDTQPTNLRLTGVSEKLEENTDRFTISYRNHSREFPKEKLLQHTSKWGFYNTKEL